MVARTDRGHDAAAVGADRADARAPPSRRSSTRCSRGAPPRGHRGRVPRGRRGRRRRVVSPCTARCGAAAALAVVVFAPILYYMVLHWRRVADYSHGFLIAPLAFYFAWERRTQLARAPIEPSWWGLRAARARRARARGRTPRRRADVDARRLRAHLDRPGAAAARPADLPDPRLSALLPVPDGAAAAVAGERDRLPAPAAGGRPRGLACSSSSACRCCARATSSTCPRLACSSPRRVADCAR